MMTRIRRFALPYLPIILAPIVLLAPVLFRGEALFWGTPFLQFIPWRYWAWNTLLAGQNPLWNPWVGMGAPLAANYQSALFYPPNWLLIPFAAAGEGWFAWSQTLLVIAHWILAGLGMVWLMRDLGLDDLAQTVSGLAFGLSGYLVARAGFFSINAAAAWLPWVLWAGTRASGTFGEAHGWIKRTLPLALCVGMLLLAGHAQTAWYTMLLLVAWVGFWGGVRGGGIRGVVQGWLALVPGVLLGVMLAAVQLIPTFEYLQQSQRADAVSMDFALTYSFYPWQILGLIMPGIFGSPVSGDFWGYGNYWEGAIYIGMLPVLLAVLAVARRKKQDDPLQKLILATLVLLLVTLIWALGKFTPIFPFLFEHVPTFDMFQAPGRVMIWLEFGLALLAGMGIHGLQRPVGKSLTRVRRGVAVCAAIILAGGAVWFLMPMIKTSFGKSMALAGMWALGTVVLILKAPAVGYRGSSFGWKLAVTLWLAVDLLAADWGLNPGTNLSLYTQRETVPQTAQRIYLSEQDEYDLKFNQYLNFHSFMIDVPWKSMKDVVLPNAGMLDYVATANNFDPLLPDRYVTWLKAVDGTSPSQKAGLLALMNVGAVERLASDGSLQTNWTVVNGAKRVHFAAEAIPATDGGDALQKTLALAESGADVWDQKVVIEGGDPGDSTGREAREVQITVESEKPDQITMTVSTDEAGWLVLSDVNYPGWQVWVDGAEKSIYTANALFRAVQLDSGEHRVDWRYQPGSFRAGAWISAVSALILLAGWLKILRQKVAKHNS